MARCVSCALARAFPGLVLVMSADEAEGAVNDALRRRSPGREADMPSRADRNRLRRMIHHDYGVATLVYRARPHHQKEGVRP